MLYTGKQPQPASVFGVSQRVQEHYVVEAMLAKGGMGQVYRARDVVLDREVAIKVLHPGVRDRVAGDASALAEARALSRLQHPNVVQVYGFGAHSGHWYMVMEFVPGRTLREHAARAMLSPSDALYILGQIAAGLAHAHQRGIIHGDIKPENVLITDVDRDPLFVKVVDFGLARFLGDTGPIGGLGTPLYMAPEQIQGGAASARSDVYALGLLAWELLVGAHPFARVEPVTLLWAQQNQDPEPLTQRAPPPWNTQAVEAAVAAAVAKAPEDRFESPVAFVDALAEAVALEPELPALPRVRRTREQLQAVRFAFDTLVEAPRQDAISVAGAASPWCEMALVAARVELAHGSGRELYRGEAAVGTEAIAQRFSQCLAERGGVPRDLAGGELLATFQDADGGVDEARERAIDAALALRNAAREIESDPTLGFPLRPRVAVGVAAGSVLMAEGWLGGRGVLGGATVREAQELSRAAESGQVLATESALRGLHGVFRGRWDAAEHAGYAIEQRRPYAIPLPSSWATQSLFVGRQVELAVLSRAFERVRTSGTFGVVAVVGPNGVGKTRLMWEVLAAIDREGAPSVCLSGRCSPDRTGPPHEPIADMLRARLARGGELPAGDLLDLVTALMAAVCGQPEISVTDQAVVLSRFLGLGATGGEPIDPRRQVEGERHAAVRALAGLLRGLAFEEVLVLHIDDFERARPGTRTLLRELAVELAEDPVLLLLGTSEEQQGDVQQLKIPFDRTEAVRVGPLSAGEADKLVRAIAGDAADDELVRRVVQSSAGLPGRVEAMTHAVLNQGIGAGLRTADEALLAAIANLSDPVVAALERAAVAGVVAWIGLVDPEETVETPGWRRLRQLGLLMPDRPSRLPSERQLSFVSADLRQAIYRNLDPKWRRVQHASTARWLIEIAGESSAVDDLVRHHASEGGELILAARYALRAADAAMLAHAGDDALPLYREALEHALASEPGGEADGLLRRAYLSIAQGAMLVGKPEQAFEHLAHAEADARAMADHGFAVWLDVRRAEIEEVVGDAPAALAALERASAADDLPVGVALTIAARRAMILARQGRFAEARSVGEEALTLPAAGEPPVESDARRQWDRALGTLHGALGHALVRTGELDAGEAHYERSREYWDNSGYLVARAMAALNLGNAAWWRGDTLVARARWDEAHRTAWRAGHLHGVAISLANLAELHLSKGEPQTALDMTERARSVLELMGSRDHLGEVLRLTAEALLYLTRLDEAGARAREAVDEAGHAGNPAMAGAALRTLGRVHRALGDEDSAWRTFEAAIQAFHESGQQNEVERTTLERGGSGDGGGTSGP